MNMAEAKIRETRYVLAVQDLEKSAEYYETKLGFSTWFKGSGWQFLRRESFNVMLGECSDDRLAFETRNHSYFAYIELENVDELYQEYIAKGVDVGPPPHDKPWGMREFILTTIDGHRMTFGKRI